jgi:hypothetical protein
MLSEAMRISGGGPGLLSIVGRLGVIPAQESAIPQPWNETTDVAAAHQVGSAAEGFILIYGCECEATRW